MCLSLLVFHEARSEPIKGKQAVVEVVMNRTKDERFPKTPCDVIKQKGQFSWVSNPNNLKPPKYEKEAWKESQEVVIDYLSKRTKGKETKHTKGALFFNSTRMGVRYKTGKSPVVCGRHIFY